jgi:Na+/H+ antiporter NhaD/arsenite permease-like protein
METYVILVFAIGYLAIALEHPIKINKAASALLTGVLCWTLFTFSDSVTSGEPVQAFIKSALSHHLAAIASILFFLMGAMTIVELIDAHHGFRFITNLVKTSNPRKLLWIVAWITFFLSALLDNLTTTIVMVSLTRKLIPERAQKLLFIGMIVIAANAGGAWSPIGDVTTTMLWIGGQVTSMGLITKLFLPSVVCLLLPLILMSFTMSRAPIHQDYEPEDAHYIAGSKTMLFTGLGALLFVPVFKSVTHLPPFMGMLLGLGVVWLVSEFINPDLDEAERKKYSAANALSRIDTSSVLFFFGILLAVSALDSMEILQKFSHELEAAVGNQSVIITLIGMISAIVDNVPLVAASMGMYSLAEFPQDSMIWQYLAYCAGTGGSLLIIGSAAGVAAMGMERIDFIWYLKKIAGMALVGYVGGAATFLFQQSL